MNTLFLNLTRFGDLLQTQPAIAASRGQGARPGLLCLDSFAPVAELLRGLEYVRSISPDIFVGHLEEDWQAALGACLRLGRATAAEFAPQRLVSLTASLSARLLARQLARASAGEGAEFPEILGFGLDDLGFGYCSSPWATFLQAATMKRGCSPFNLVDLFCKASGLEQGPWPNELLPPSEAARSAAQRLLGPVPRECEGFVALQLGASQDRRRWPVERFAQLGLLCRERLRLMPVLLGSQGEAELAARYLAHGAPGLNLAGKTGFGELAGVLEHCRLLVSNDTGTMHLAAGLGRPVTGIFLATAQPWDTGPYAPGNVCLEPDMDCHPCEFGAPCPIGHACRQRIPAETVFASVTALLGQEQAQETAWARGARVWRTALQEAGFMGLECLSGHEGQDRTQWVRLQRHIYRHFLDQRPLPTLEKGVALSAQARAEALETLATAEQLLTLLEQQAAVLARTPLEPVKKKFLGVWQRVQALFSRSALFNVLSYLFAAQSQEAGQDMASVGELLGRYRGLVKDWQVILRIP